MALLFPAAILLVGAPAGVVLVAAAAVVRALERDSGRGWALVFAPPTRDEKLLWFASVVFVLASTAARLLRHETPSRDWLPLLLFALLIPVHAFLRRNRPFAGALWGGMAIGAAAAGLLRLATVLGAERVVPTPPDGVAGLPLVAGSVAAVGLLTGPRRWWSSLAAVAALLLGGFAGIPELAGSGSLSGGEPARALSGSWLDLLGPIVVLVVPTAGFVRALRHEYAPIRGIGAAGLTLVTGYALLAALSPVFRLDAPVAFFVLSVPMLYVLARRAEAEHYATPVERSQKLSVTIIAMNEADRIERCLDSVAGWADEIVVLDSGSTDGTVERVKHYTDKVWETDWPGYGPQKQRALDKATGDWVLSIDADEVVTPELRHDIDSVLGPSPGCVGYRLPWGVIVYGKMLDFGRSARSPMRLFRREGSRFQQVQVHEGIELPPGAVGTLRGRLLHYTHRDFGHALEKSSKYAWLGAKKRLAAGKRGGGLIGASVRAVLTFLQVYFVRLGFLDGRPGFLVAVTYGQGSFNKYAGLWALRREASHRQRG